MLHSLNSSSYNCPSDVGAGAGDGTLEANEPRVDIASVRGHGPFVFMVRDDFREFVLDVLGGGRLSSNVGERLGRFLNITLLDKISW